MSLTASQQNFHNPYLPSLLTEDLPVDTLHDILRERGCAGCELGKQQGLVGPVVYRGNPQANIMVIGEAPGEGEDIRGFPFIGPAGKLFNKIMAGIYLDTDTDCYITNTNLCRPIAHPSTGKKNKKPLVSQRKACKPYLLHQIEQVKPKTILLLGKSAVDSILPAYTKKSMGDIVGKPAIAQQFPNVVFFIMYHPSYLLHKQPFPDEYQKVRREMWQHALEFKLLLEE